MPGVWAVIASGPSLTKEDVELVRAARDDGRLAGVAAVSNVGLDLAPWADCLVSHDSAWWASYPEGLEFAGEKVCANSQVRGGRQFRPLAVSGCNSGLMAMQYIWKNHKAQKIIIVGFDMTGSHYFGEHTRGKLRNTSLKRFNDHIQQFNGWSGPEVINCSRLTCLTQFPIVALEECLIDDSAHKS